MPGKSLAGEREGIRGPAPVTKEKAPAEGSRSARPVTWLQRAAGNAAVAALVSGSSPAEGEAVRRWGPPRDDAGDEAHARASEAFVSTPAFDPERVHIHTDGEAGALAAGLRATAFTHGRDIYFHRSVRPDTALGNRVLAHELTHVAQQERSGVAAIQRSPDPPPAGPTDADAAADQKMVSLQDVQPGILTLNNAVDWGGLAGWRTRLPRSYPEMRRRAVVQYGEQAIAWLESHDADVLALASKSEAVQARLLEQRDYWAGLGPEAETAQAVVDFYRGVDYLWGDDVRGVYQVSYSYFAEQYSKDIHFDLRLYQQIMAGGVDELVQGVGAQAFSAAADAKAAREQCERWTAAGAALVGNQVAKREGIFFNDSIKLETLLEPTYGSTDETQMMAIARLAGHTCAVVRVDGRYYTYTLTEDYDRTDVFASSDWDQASLLVEAGDGPPARVISTSDGFLLTRDYASGRFFGGGQVRAEAAMAHLEADTRLVDSGDAARFGLSPTALFLSMCRNLALVNLAEAEQHMHGIVGQMAPQGMMDPAQGEALQRDTARLRELTVQADRLAEEIGDAAPSETQSDQRDDLLTEMGTLVQRSPAAAFFVTKDSPWWAKATWAVSPVAAAAITVAGAAPKPVVSDELEGLMSGDAALRAMNEARDRLENIAKVRRALFDDPDIVLGFEPLHEAVLEHFSTSDRFLIKASLVFRDFKNTAKTIGLAALDLGLLIGGFFTGGATWVGLGVEAVGTGLGLYQLDQQIRHASLLTAESQLDVPGGFQMATEEAAASARKWAIFSAAVTFLGLVGLARSASRLLREAEEEANLVGRIANRAGVSTETAALALRRTWRGIPNPDPGALRELLLAGLPRAMRERYAQLPITVLNEEQWAARFGANSAEHAATSFATRASGELYPTEVVFRAQGNVFAMQHEAQHILQAADPLFAGRLRQLSELSVDAWARMSSTARLQTMRTVLELELDGQERLLARAQAAGDTQAMDDLFAEMEDITGQMGDLDKAIAEGGSAHPDWFDPSRAPTYLFGGPRLPRSKGTWSGAPGNSIWTSTRPQVKALAPNGVRFRSGYPDFRPWQVGGEVRIGQTGFASDFAEADARYAERIAAGTEPVPPGYSLSDFTGRNGEGIAEGVKRYRRAEGLTWHHHQGGTVMYLVPTKLHANVPHTGGASAARAAGP
jgi:hypothetical protein